MSNELRSEFETYVKKLTTAIFNEILLAKMEDLYEKYDEEYQKYHTSTSQAVLASEVLQKRSEFVTQTIIDIDNTTKKAVADIASDIESLESHTEEMFEEMRELYRLSKDNFMLEFSGYLEDYKNQITGIITPERLNDFVEKLEENTEKSQKLAAFINDTYKTEIEKNVKQIVTQNLWAQSTVNNSISAFGDKILKDLENTTTNAGQIIGSKTNEFSDKFNQIINTFSKNLAVMFLDESHRRQDSLKEQRLLIAQIGPSDEKIEELSNQVRQLEAIVSKLKYDNLNNNMRFEETLNNYMIEQKELEKKRHSNEDMIERRAESLSWKLYMAFSNTVMIFLFVLLIIFQKPWEVFGIKYFCIISGFLILLFLAVLLLKKIIAKSVISKQEKNHIQAY